MGDLGARVLSVMATSPVALSIEGPRADIRLERPDVLNAMDFDVFDGLAAAADALHPRDDIRVVVVSGAGRSFSSGIDLSAIGAIGGSSEETVARAQAGFRKIAALPMPTVASIQGHAYGAGLQLALACDLRVVAADAKMGLLEARYGLIPDLCGSNRLPNLIGAGRAKKMIWLAETVDGTAAAAIGLAEVVVAADELTKATDELADRLIAAPATPVREAKALVEGARLRSLEEGMDAEAAAQLRCMSDREFAEILMAGLQKKAARG
ncbi:MAG: 3-hydroxypropionyl-coenzyme dehydratase [Actinomycetota bacterium]|nr:3-hydroxypropionyl-coenzyme dehydratase [Actinomycetota bacterium]